MLFYMLGMSLPNGGNPDKWVFFIYIAFAVFVAAAVTDFFDGYIARKYHLVTDMGKFLDPIADKLLVASGLFIILGYSLIPVWYGIPFVTVIIAREFIISALRQIAATKNVVIAADKLGKVKTALTVVAIPAVLLAAPLDRLFKTADVFYWIGFALLALAVLLTVVSGVNYLIVNRKVFNETTGAEKKD